MYRGGRVTTANEIRRGELGILVRYGWLAKARGGTPGYGTSVTHMTTHHDHEIRIEVLHIQIILSGQLAIIQSKPGIYMRHERTPTSYHTYDPPVGLFAT
jgi:hypothetical protein